MENEIADWFEDTPVGILLLHGVYQGLCFVLVIVIAVSI